MREKIIWVIGLAVGFIAAAFALIYLVDQSILVSGFSINKRVPSDFLRFVAILSVTAILLLFCARLLQPNEESSSFFRPKQFLRRLLVSFAVTFVLGSVIWFFWLATEL